MTNVRYDLVAVGCGAAGLAAAVTYLESAVTENRTPRVAVVERAAQADRGGATRWTSAGLRVDDEFNLDPLWVGLVQTVSNQRSDLDYCLTLEREVPKTGELLRRHGIEFISGPNPFPGTIKHIVKPRGGGQSIVDSLANYIDAAPNAEIMYETEAVRLALDEYGRIDGVVVRGVDGHTRTLSADAVVLACGGFEGNDEMLTRYLGRNAVDLRVLVPGTRFNTGDGIRMATEVGADTTGQFDGIHAELVDPRTDRPDAVLLSHAYTIAVNANSQRFFDEGAKGGVDSFELIAYEVWANQGQKAYLITDSAAMNQDLIAARFETDVPPARADTIGDLARQLGLEPNALERTVAEFNAACSDAPWDPFRFDGKRTSDITPPKSNWANPISQAPFYGFPAAAAVCFTFGGLKTDTSARVLSGSGFPIPGLYAAGELVGLFYHEYPSGTSVLKALTFGRLAAQDAARYNKGKS